jgi:hypothetical protein
MMRTKVTRDTALPQKTQKRKVMRARKVWAEKPPELMERRVCQSRWARRMGLQPPG